MWPRVIGVFALSIVSAGWQAGPNQTLPCADDRPIAHFGHKDMGLSVAIDRDDPRYLTVVVSGNDKGPSPDKRLRVQIRFWDETRAEGTPEFQVEVGNAGSYYRHYRFDAKRPLTLAGVVFLTISVGD